MEVILTVSHELILMKLLVNKFFVIYLLPLSLVLNSVSIDFLHGFNDRIFFKLLSLLILFFIFIFSCSFNKKFLYLIFLSFAFYFSLFFSDFINNIEVSYIPLARLIASIIFLWVLISSEVLVLEKAINTYSKLLFIVAIIGLFFLIFPQYHAEKIPVLNIYSTKSIIFEQNVYGISVYFLFLYLLSKGNNITSSFFSLLAVFSSYYRTVIALSFIRLVFTKLSIPIIFVTFSMSLLYFNELSSLLKFEQLSSLTGRDVLWEIGLIGFSESPIWGNGESKISQYSNIFLNRTPAFTTYHNVFVDLLFSGGVISFLFYCILLVVVYSHLKFKDSIFLSLLLAPSILNTYYLFSFNILSGFISIWVIHRIKVLNIK